jgi:predicted  nucleic acid-binding Zn-ribbon protein
VITDLFSGYKEIISHLFKKAIHLVCHIHAGRILRKIIRHLSAVFSHKKTELGKIQNENIKIKKNLQKKRDRITFLSNRLSKDQKMVKTLTHQKQQKLTSRTKTLTVKLDKLNQRIQKDQKTIKILREERDLLIKKYRKIPAQQKEIQRKINTAQQDLLQSGRLVHDFEELLHDLTPKFEEHKQKFQQRLEQSKYTIAKDLLKMMQDNPDLFSVRNSRILSSNFQNTNTIEGLFSLFRRLLDGTRLLSSEAGSARYCDLFRLYHNTMPPFTGPHHDQSPVARLGVKLSGKSYLDLIFPVRQRVTHFFYQEKSSHNSNSLNFKVSSCVQSKILCLD